MKNFKMLTRWEWVCSLGYEFSIHHHQTNTGVKKKTTFSKNTRYHKKRIVSLQILKWRRYQQQQTTTFTSTTINIIQQLHRSGSATNRCAAEIVTTSRKTCQQRWVCQQTNCHKQLWQKQKNTRYPESISTLKGCIL